MKNRRVLVLPGDNIGPEIIAEAVKVLDRVNGCLLYTSPSPRD